MVDHRGHGRALSGAEEPVTAMRPLLRPLNPASRRDKVNSAKSGIRAGIRWNAILSPRECPITTDQGARGMTQVFGEASALVRTRSTRPPHPPIVMTRLGMEASLPSPGTPMSRGSANARGSASPPAAPQGSDIPSHLNLESYTSPQESRARILPRATGHGCSRDRARRRITHAVDFPACQESEGQQWQGVAKPGPTADRTGLASGGSWSA